MRRVTYGFHGYAMKSSHERLYRALADARRRYPRRDMVEVTLEPGRDAVKVEVYFKDEVADEHNR